MEGGSGPRNRVKVDENKGENDQNSRTNDDVMFRTNK
jgi:hypothetical protein